jgi:hypothetical protein
MELAFNINKAKKFYREVNNKRKRLKPQTLLFRNKEGNTARNKERVLPRLSQYCVKHFERQDGRDSDSGEVWTVCVQTVESYVEPPNDADIEMAIRKLQNRKATGCDKIPGALIKGEGKELKKLIYELISKLLEEEITPLEWKCVIICPIDKKGDVMIDDN